MHLIFPSDSNVFVQHGGTDQNTVSSSGDKCVLHSKHDTHLAFIYTWFILIKYF